MLRGIGGALFLLACLLFGRRLSAAEGRKTKQIEGLLNLLRHIRTGIVCFSSPMAEICADFRDATLEECGFLPALRKHGFSHALQECKALSLADEERRTLSAFAAELGKSDTAAQAAVCDYTMTVLARAVERRQAEGPRRARAAWRLSLCGGMMLLLLLI